MVRANTALWEKKYPAPAKINLMLRIVGRRADGYHLLQTVFQFIELCDWLSFYPVDDGRVFLKNTLNDVAESDNLIIKAALLLKKETDCQLGAGIEIEKHIPMGGGLGGGSSDAATTLVVLNQLWDLQLSTERLMELGLSLGADVPIFVKGHASWAEGVGEQLQEINPAEQWLVLIKPDCHVNTKEIFLTQELTRDSKSITIADFIAGSHQNDCLAVVSQRYPLVQQAMEKLSEFSPARLTGTGACVFALFALENEAKAAYQSLKDEHQTYLSKGINISPLLTELNN
ncbi:MAG: 4-(cytidine 5'-diphospho)-2-C-methyl-D-erythritol kinase [Methylococcaceae bacterium]